MVEEFGVCELALDSAHGIDIIREAVDSVASWELALEQTVSDLDRFWQAFFAYFASVFSLFTFFEHDGFGLRSRRRNASAWVLAAKLELRKC